ncbi:hypothetical protein PC120_g11358 [Phytophthora cactorum]|nr:hypothetical protein PC120_g11358 [Phytophthora cactorum]
MRIILATNFATLEDITKGDADMEGIEEEEAAAIREPTSGGDNSKLNTKPSDGVSTKTDAKAEAGQDDRKPDAELGDTADVDADKAPDVDDDETSTNAKFCVGSRGIDEDEDSGKGENGGDAIDMEDDARDGEVNGDDHIMGSYSYIV